VLLFTFVCFVVIFFCIQVIVIVLLHKESYCRRFTLLAKLFFTDQLQNPWQMLAEPLSSAEPRLRITGLQAMGQRPSAADWGSGMSASCKPRVQLFADVGNGWPHSVLRYH